MSTIYLDEKVTIWYRHYFDPEKVTKEQLIAGLKSNIDTVVRDEMGHTYSETMLETVEYITPKDNGNNPTLELYAEDEDSTIQEMVWDNVNGEVKDD